MVRQIFRIFLGWRLAVLLVALIAVVLVPLRSGYTEVSASFKPDNLLQMWINFDGLHYLDIARNGYTPTHQAGQAFFPFYPLIVKVVTNIIHNDYLSGLVVSHLSLFIALVFLYKLVRLDYQKTVAQNTIWTLLLFPTAFFFICFYSEAIFLLEVVLAFYFARTNRWLFASICCALATATRVTGVFLIPAIFIEFLIAHNRSFRKSLQDRQIFWLILSPLGLLLYMQYLYQTTQDPLYFIHVLPTYGVHRQLDHIVLLYQVFYRYFKMLIFINHQDPLFFVISLEFVVGLLFTGLSLLAFKVSRLSYALFTSASFLLPTLLGTFSSVPRYVIVLFPAFIVLGQWFGRQNQKVKYLYIAVNLIISIITISLFTRGYFIG